MMSLNFKLQITAFLSTLFMAPLSFGADLNWIVGNYSVLSAPETGFIDKDFRPCKYAEAKIYRKIINNYDYVLIEANGMCDDRIVSLDPKGLSAKGVKGYNCVEDQNHIKCTSSGHGFELKATLQGEMLVLQLDDFGDYVSSETWTLQKK